VRSADERRVAHWQGVLAERLAIFTLRLKLYSILARRYRIRGVKSTLSRGAATPSLSSK
jgi:hypothetical protein